LVEPESISFGTDCIVYPRCWINVVSEWAGQKYNGEIRMGDRVKISYEAQLSAAALIEIGDDVTLSRGVVITDHVHDYRHVDMSVLDAPLSKPMPIRIGRRSFVGAHAMIGPGVQIGEHAMVAANSVVVNDVPPYAIAVGNPARAVRFHKPEASERADIAKGQSA
jgi:acetyltransferase-like isoleucine patch superfamily enzyme